MTDLRAARAGAGARATISLADDLLDADIGRATQSVSRIAGATGELQSALRETRECDLLRRAATAADAVPELLRLQRQTPGILQQSLAIQRSIERHAASLDRKTAGTAPVAAPLRRRCPDGRRRVSLCAVSVLGISGQGRQEARGARSDRQRGTCRRGLGPRFEARRRLRAIARGTSPDFDGPEGQAARVPRALVIRERRIGGFALNRVDPWRPAAASD